MPHVHGGLPLRIALLQLERLSFRPFNSCQTNTRIPCAVSGAIGIALFRLDACLVPCIIYTGSISKPLTCLCLRLGLKGASSHVSAAFTFACRCRYGESAGQQHAPTIIPIATFFMSVPPNQVNFSYHKSKQHARRSIHDNLLNLLSIF